MKTPSLLHYAAGGEGKVTESGIERGRAAIEPMKELIKRNQYQFEMTTIFSAACCNEQWFLTRSGKYSLDAGAKFPIA